MKHKHKVPQPRPIRIPKEGALGLLALGAAGLRAWREARDADESKGSDQKPAQKSGAQHKGEA